MKRRARKVASALQGQLSSILLMDAQDPQLSRVSVTEVEVTDDLRRASVYFTMLGQPAPTPDTYKAIRRAMPYLRSQIAEGLGLRYVPELEFVEDKHQDELNRVLGLLDGLNPPTEKES